MARSFLAALVATTILALGAVGCATQKPAGTKPLPLEVIRTATMDITPGIEVLNHIALPNGFAPAPAYAPMWLQNGKEIAIAGTQNGHAIVMGYSGSAYRTARIIAQDGGIGAPHGNIVDIAASPNGMALALAVENPGQDPSQDPGQGPGQDRLDVVIRDLISEGAANPIADFEGRFDKASIGWLGEFTIPLALRAAPAGQSSPASAAAGTPTSPTLSPTAAASGLYVINSSGIVTTGYLKLDCKMSALSWSPGGLLAAGLGDSDAPAVILDRGKETCRRINAQAPLRLLDWSHDSKAFLYQENNRAIGIGVYRYDVATNGHRLVAISSGAAAFVGNDQILALGSGSLTFRGAQAAPDGQVRAEVALSDATGGDTQVNSLGFNSTPAMLAASTMTYTHATDEAAIGTFSPAANGPMRKIVIYSVAPKHAFLVAFGPVRGALAMSWSPRGRYLAIADGDASGAALTILSPPR